MKLLENTDYKFNGDFRLGITIGGKIPDFVNVNGQKKVIELFGEPWHKLDSPFKVSYRRTEKGTLEIYKKCGWSCLIIWHEELRNMKNVEDKINQFNVHSKVVSPDNFDDKSCWCVYWCVLSVERYKM